MSLIAKSSIKYVNDLSKNNNRPWFQDHKDEYQAALDNIKEFQAALVTEMNKYDEIEKHKLFRIYRDVRFSKDKTPYNPDWRMSMSRAGTFNRGGYYLKIGPKETFLAAGFWGPEPKDLKLIRDHISADPKPLRKILASKKFISTFGNLEGEQVKTAPKGFDKDDPAIDLLKYKQFIVTCKIDKKIITTDSFIKEVTNRYKAIRPFFDYMSEILTHDLNGVPLY